MRFTKHIPNTITLLNLVSGTIAAVLASQQYLFEAVLFILLGILFDFFDGFAARLLKVQGALGKQLDSLADVVTSGVAPGIIMYQLLVSSFTNEWSNGLSCEIGNWEAFSDTPGYWLSFLGFIYTMGAAYRLAKFNIDERQSTGFIGLPTPAAALVVISLPLIQQFSSHEMVQELIQNSYVLLLITAVLAVVMNAEIALFSLKITSFSWKASKKIYLFLVGAIVLLLVFEYVAIPIIILSYLIVSLGTEKQKEL